MLICESGSGSVEKYEGMTISIRIITHRIEPFYIPMLNFCSPIFESFMTSVYNSIGIFNQGGLVSDNLTVIFVRKGN